MHLLPFELKMIENTTEEELVVLARGFPLLSYFCIQTEMFKNPTNLALIINTREYENKIIEGEISGMFFKNLNIEKTKRAILYKNGGIFIVKNQSLLNDMINQQIEIEKITAIFILNAHKLKPNGQVAFIISILRKYNKDCIIKAYTDEPVLLNQKIFPLEELANILQINRISFFPRFRNDIKNDYAENKIKLKALKIPLHPSKEIEIIQIHIFNLLKAIINEISILEKIDLDFSFIYKNKIFNRFKDSYSNIAINQFFLFRDLLELLFIDYKIFLEYLEYIKTLKISWIESPNFKILEEALNNLHSNEMNIKIKKLENILEENRNFIIAVENYTICDLLRHSLHQRKNKNYKFCTFKTIDDVGESEILLLSFDLYALRHIERMGYHCRILYYKNTYEEEKYLTELRWEKEAFVKLIKERENLPKIITEIKELDKNINIDFRELRSTLPYYLYKNGWNVNLTCLKTGDYILSNNIAVERKRLDDLIQSLGNKLLKQINEMTYKYNKSFLLIEFISDYSILSLKPDLKSKKNDLKKFINLIINLNIQPLYSASDYMTLKHFTEIEHINDLKYEEHTYEKIDPSLIEIFYNIDGIDNNNINKILQFKSLSDLVNTNRNDLLKIFGLENGNKIYDFFN